MAIYPLWWVDVGKTQGVGTSPARVDRQRLFAWAAAFSGGAALVHGVAVDEHFREWWGYGLFFLFAGIAQMFYAVILLTRPWRRTPPRAADGAIERRMIDAGIAGNAFLIVLYAATRTVGIPFFGPAAGAVESVSFAGVLAKVLEAALIVTLVRLRRAANSAAPDAPTTAADA